jgi:hypothetical protein
MDLCGQFKAIRNQENNFFLSTYCTLMYLKLINRTFIFIYYYEFRTKRPIAHSLTDPIRHPIRQT